MFRVVNRDRETVDFKLQPEQAHLDENFTRRNLVTKVRQHAGISAYMIGRYVAKCLVQENRSCVLVSHEAEATARLLDRARFIIDHLKGGAQRPRTSTDSSRAIVFTDTGSSFWIGTAGQRSFGRGDTISDLHLSEAAFYEDPERIVDGLFPAAENGEITVESTGNGRGNWFHRQAQRARQGIGFKLFFYSWVGLPSARLMLSPEGEAQFLRSLQEELEEPQLYYEQGVALAQLAWRRERITVDYDGDLSRFKENYPREFEECFRSAGLSFFPSVRFKETPKWLRSKETQFLWRLEGHPKQGHRYVGGGDVGGGVGQDNSCLQLFDLDDRVQVAEWTGSHLGPDEFGHVCSALGKEFNHAYLNIERNNHGLTTLAVLVGDYPLDRLHRGTNTASPNQVILSHLGSYGTYVSETTRGLLLGTARAALANEYTLHSEFLKDELSTFVESRSGKFEAASGCFDDRVMAACHAMLVTERANIATYEPLPVEHRPTIDPFSFEGLFKDQSTPGTTTYGISERFG